MAAVLEGLKILIDIALILVLPGVAWSFVIVPGGTVEWAERVALSVGLSVTLMAFMLFWMNWLLGLEITLITAETIAFVLIFLAVSLGDSMLQKPTDALAKRRGRLWIFAKGWSNVIRHRH